jgi:hypothetical protein
MRGKNATIMLRSMCGRCVLFTAFELEPNTRRIKRDGGDSKANIAFSNRQLWFMIFKNRKKASNFATASPAVSKFGNQAYFRKNRTFIHSTVVKNLIPLSIFVENQSVAIFRHHCETFRRAYRRTRMFLITVVRCATKFDLWHKLLEQTQGT